MMSPAAWRTTAKLSLTQLFAWGVLYYTFAVCMPFMHAELGWSEARLSLGFSLALLLSGLAAPQVGGWIDRRGSRGVMVGGVLVGSLGVAVWSISQSLPQYLAAWALIGVAMATTLYEPAFATVIHTHPGESRRAIIWITLVGALAATLFMPASEALFRVFGWRPGLQIMALGLAIAAVPASAALPRPTGASETGGRAVEPVSARPRSFWILGAVLMLANAVAVAVTTHAVAFLMHHGQSVQVAAGIVGLTGLAKLAGRLVMAGGRLPAAAILQGTLLLQGITLVLPLVLPSVTALVAMVLVFGATSGAHTILRPVLVVETFGTARFGKNNGVLQLITTVAKSTAPLGVGFAAGWVGYDGAWMGLALLACTSSGLLFLLPRPVSKRAPTR